MNALVRDIPPKFAGHETFTLRYGWLKKAVDATLERQDIFLQVSPGELEPATSGRNGSSRGEWG